MEEEKVIKKPPSDNHISYFQQNKKWFNGLPKLRKLVLVLTGICLLLALYIVSVLVRYSDTSISSIGNKANISGNVTDQSGKPIEGAVVVNSNNVAVAGSDGIYKIQANISDTLTVSAYGYESIHVLASQPTVALFALPLGTVRLAVVGPENQKLKSALVYRLNANSFIPVAIGLTNQLGEILFENIPSGQAAFVILHPDYGFGWLQTSLNPGEAIRPVVRLIPVQAEKKSASAGFKLIKPVYGQSPINPAFEKKTKLALEFARVEKLSDDTYNIAQETQTILAYGTDRETLLKYIKILENDYDFNRIPNNLIGEGEKKFNEIVSRELSPLSIVRVKEGPYQTHYTVEQGSNSNGQETKIACKTENRNIIIEVGSWIPKQGVAVLQAQHAVNTENNRSVVVTNWSKASAAELGGIETVRINLPQAPIICCGQSDGPSGTGSRNPLPAEVSSNEIPPSDLALNSSGDKTHYLYYSHRDINEMMGKPNLETIAAGILEQNPKLSFVDKTTGSSFSFLEIPPPNPNDAPPAFLLDFFENASDARSDFLNRSISYQSKWKQFMATIGSDVFQKEGRTPYQVYWDLKKDIGTSQAWREAEEKKLAEQSGQQNSNQPAEQSEPVNSQDSEQTDSSDTQDEGPQATIAPSSEPEQSDQAEPAGQGPGNSSSSQGSGTGTNKSSSGGGGSGGAVQPR